MWLKKIGAIDLNKKYFQGNAVQRDFLWRSSSQKTLTLKSFILNCGVNLTPDEIFEPSIEISNDLTMDSDAYLKLLDGISSFRYVMSFSLRYECFNGAQVFSCFMQTYLIFL